MRFEPGYLIGMAMQSIPEPRKVAREVQALRYSRAVLWQAFALFCILSTGLGVAASIIAPVPPEFEGSLLADPLRMGLLEAAILVMAVFAIFWVGRMFGGKGRFDQAILTVTWVQWVLFLLQVLLVALLAFAPIMAMLVQYFAIGVMFWLLSNFIAEMHGFQSVGLVFVMIVLTLMGALFGLSVILVLIGAGAGAIGSL